jgi:hypothetical protein
VVQSAVSQPIRGHILCQTLKGLMWGPKRSFYANSRAFPELHPNFAIIDRVPMNLEMAMEEEKAVRMIRKWVRRCLERRRTRLSVEAKEALIQTKAVLVIQKWFRGCLERRRTRLAVEAAKALIQTKAVGVIEKWFRGCLERRRTRLAVEAAEALIQTKAVRVIQKWFRGCLERQRLRMVVLEMETLEKQRQCMRMAVLELETCEKQRQRMRIAVLELVTREKQHKERSAMEVEAVIKIQNWYRRRRQVRKLIEAAHQDRDDSSPLSPPLHDQADLTSQPYEIEVITLDDESSDQEEEDPFLDAVVKNEAVREEAVAMDGGEETVAMDGGEEAVAMDGGEFVWLDRLVQSLEQENDEDDQEAGVRSYSEKDVNPFGKKSDWKRASKLYRSRELEQHELRRVVDPETNRVTLRVQRKKHLYSKSLNISKMFAEFDTRQEERPRLPPRKVIKIYKISMKF